MSGVVMEPKAAVRDEAVDLAAAIDPALEPSDPRTLEGAMEQYQTALLRYAARVLNSEDAARDVVQETFIRLNANLEKIKRRGVKVKGWLFRVAHNAAVDHIRKESRRRTLHER